jgi:alanine racemase
VLGVQSPLRLTIDGSALAANWRWLAARSGSAACGAAVKADGYGLGAEATVRQLVRAGCRDFFVATWAEADAVRPMLEGAALSVLHGVGADDMPQAMLSDARPVLNSAAQVARWKANASGRPCDVMVDTGMNRLGISPAEATSGLLDGLAVDTLMSHLACADVPNDPMNERQRAAFQELRRAVPAARYSLANSAGILLGADYAHDLTRPGLALYGGRPQPAADGHIAPVARIEARIVQRRRVSAGQTIGYNATFETRRDMEVAILNIGYADGYFRGFSDAGHALAGGAVLPVVGRVSMDLTAVCVDAAAGLDEGEWVELGFDLPASAAASGMSQYELLTGLGHRYQRIWS